VQNNIIHTMYVCPRPEAQLSTCLHVVTVKDEDLDSIAEIGDVHASRKSIILGMYC